MNVLLPAEIEKYVAEKIESGRYGSANEVILEALELLKERDEGSRRRLDELRRDLQVGIDQADGGRISDFDESTLGEVKARGLGRLAASREGGLP